MTTSGADKGEAEKQWTLVDLATHHKKQLRENLVEFQRIFGRPLHKFMHPLLGDRKSVV